MITLENNHNHYVRFCSLYGKIWNKNRLSVSSQSIPSSAFLADIMYFMATEFDIVKDQTVEQSRRQVMKWILTCKSREVGFVCNFLFYMHTKIHTWSMVEL